MQIRVETETLETIFAHSMAVARFADGIDDAVVFDALTKAINEISRTVAGLLGKPYGPRPEGGLHQDGEPEFNIASAVDDLRQRVARTDALANAAEKLFAEVILDEENDDGRRLERLAQLIAATYDAVQPVIEIGDRLAVELSTRLPGW